MKKKTQENVKMFKYMKRAAKKKGVSSLLFWGVCMCVAMGLNCN